MNLFFRLGVLAFLTIPASHGAVLFYEAFDSVLPGYYGSSSLIGQLLVTSGDVDVLGPGYYGVYCVSPASGNCLDLNGFAQGTVTSAPLSLSAGTYNLQFVLNGSQRANTAQVRVVVGTYVNTVLTRDSTDTSVVSLPFTVVAPDTAVIQFVSLTDGANGLTLDEITLFEGVPEPSTWLLVAGALTAGVFLRARRVR